ncbi:MAG: hypothetical protein WBD01_06685 [Salaquimonas sp.]
MTDNKLNPLMGILKRTNLDALAFVPGPNFRRLFLRDFHLMERPLVVLVPAAGEPVAIVPNLEMASFEPINFPGSVFDWRDEEGFLGALKRQVKPYRIWVRAVKSGWKHSVCACSNRWLWLQFSRAQNL